MLARTDDGVQAITGQTLLRYTLFNAPWALICTLSFGLSNYLIILFISHYDGLAEAGRLRLFLSILELIGISTLLDTPKIVIKNMVMGKHGVVRPLMFHRAKWSLAGMAIGCVVAAAFQQKGDDAWIAILIASLLLPFIYAGDTYDSMNQAKQLFRANAFCALSKFGSLTILALVMGRLGMSVVYFMVAYSIVVSAFHVYFVTRHREPFDPAAAEADELKRQSVQLSAAGVFPVLLMQVDKLLISYFLGLEALGLYTIGISTGNLFLHFIRPSLTIYFPFLVNSRPSLRLLLTVAGVLTVIGGIGAWLLQFYFVHVLSPKFIDAYPIAAVPVVGLGLCSIGVVSYYSSVYHRGSNIRIPTITNIITAGVVAIYLLASVLLGGKYALLLCAASYPLRELVNVIVINALTRRFEADAKACPVL